ncbi:MAG: hypothetical protein FJZ95_06520 [Chloroflexi bacterium]|nr:hypothetical protein [Chloroflexota bacterium]
MPTASEGYRPEPLQNAPVYHGTERPLLRRAPIGRCECCNNVIREGEKRCRYCGGAVKQMPAPLSTHTGKVLPLNRQAILHCLDKSADKEALRISACPLCGDMVRIGWERCPRCGEPLDARLQFPVLRKDNPKSEATGKAP